ncbi:hypothetical protein ACN1C3_11945 [Pseudomonas sp. H11T01]|uniref:hypothetical protein n=1 Tax=Pseudomonas sp. H11T01 TaxID=3402749 RepID=UPI003AC159D2
MATTSVVFTLPKTAVESVKEVLDAGFAGVLEAEDAAGGSAAKAEALKASISAETNNLVMGNSF